MRSCLRGPGSERAWASWRVPRVAVSKESLTSPCLSSTSRQRLLGGQNVAEDCKGVHAKPALMMTAQSGLATSADYQRGILCFGALLASNPESVSQCDAGRTSASRPEPRRWRLRTSADDGCLCSLVPAAWLPGAPWTVMLWLRLLPGARAAKPGAGREAAKFQESRQTISRPRLGEAAWPWLWGPGQPKAPSLGRAGADWRKSEAACWDSARSSPRLPCQGQVKGFLCGLPGKQEMGTDVKSLPSSDRGCWGSFVSRKRRRGRGGGASSLQNPHPGMGSLSL